MAQLMSTEKRWKERLILGSLEPVAQVGDIGWYLTVPSPQKCIFPTGYQFPANSTLTDDSMSMHVHDAGEAPNRRLLLTANQRPLV